VLGVWMNRWQRLFPILRFRPVITMVYMIENALVFGGIGLRVAFRPERSGKATGFGGFTLDFRIKKLGIDKLSFRPRSSH